MFTEDLQILHKVTQWATQLILNSQQGAFGLYMDKHIIFCLHPAFIFFIQSLFWPPNKYVSACFSILIYFSYKAKWNKQSVSCPDFLTIWWGRSLLFVIFRILKALLMSPKIGEALKICVISSLLYPVLEGSVFNVISMITKQLLTFIFITTISDTKLWSKWEK